MVNQALLDKGYGVGDRARPHRGRRPRRPDDRRHRRVDDGRGTSRSPPGRSARFGVDAAAAPSWLVDGGPVSWATVRQLNDIGAIVASRAVINDPPPASEIPPRCQQVSTDDARPSRCSALIVVMALIEVVLLAGPAFAVSARKQQRSLALMAATGGTPKQSRRVIVAGAVVLGQRGGRRSASCSASASPGCCSRCSSRGPTTGSARSRCPWLHLVGVAGFGMLSAFLAAVVPA